MGGGQGAWGRAPQRPWAKHACKEGEKAAWTGKPWQDLPSPLPFAQASSHAQEAKVGVSRRGAQEHMAPQMGWTCQEENTQALPEVSVAQPPLEQPREPGASGDEAKCHRAALSPPAAPVSSCPAPSFPGHGPGTSISRLCQAMLLEAT